MPRRIKKAKVRHISLVPKGANKMPVMYKADDAVEIQTIVAKSDMEEGLITAVVYAPNMIDSHGDFTDASVIREMAHDFLKNGEGIDVLHDGQTLAKDAASVVESFIIAKGDERFAEVKDRDGNPVDVTGGWAAVIKVDDPALREKYRNGEWNGVSMGGSAFFEEVNDTSLLHKIYKLLTPSKPSQGDIDMTPEELKKAISDGVAEALKAAKPAEPAPVVKSDDEPKPTPVVKAFEYDEDGTPVFKGDITNAKHRSEYQKELAKHQVMSNYDLTDPEQFAKAAEEIEALTSTKKPGSNAGNKGDIAKADTDEDWATFAKSYTAETLGTGKKETV